MFEHAGAGKGEYACQVRCSFDLKRHLELEVVNYKKTYMIDVGRGLETCGGKYGDVRQKIWRRGDSFILWCY